MNVPVFLKFELLVLSTKFGKEILIHKLLYIKIYGYNYTLFNSFFSLEKYCIRIWNWAKKFIFCRHSCSVLVLIEFFFRQIRCFMAFPRNLRRGVCFMCHYFNIREKAKQDGTRRKRHRSEPRSVSKRFFYTALFVLFNWFFGVHKNA